MIKTIIFRENSYEELILKVNNSVRAATYSKQEIINVDTQLEPGVFSSTWHGSVIIRTNKMDEFNDGVRTHYRGEGIVDLSIHKI
jgi:hypothetical protein